MRLRSLIALRAAGGTKVREASGCILRRLGVVALSVHVATLVECLQDAVVGARVAAATALLQVTEDRLWPHSSALRGVWQAEKSPQSSAQCSEFLPRIHHVSCPDSRLEGLCSQPFRKPVALTRNRQVAVSQMHPQTLRPSAKRTEMHP